jgi:uncharacterized protein (DUF2147 family)
MLKKSFLIICTFVILPILSVVAQTEAADKILGTYYVSDDTSDEDCKVRITKDKSGTYSGRIFWVKNPNNKDGTPKTDIKNPDPAKRNTPGDQIPLVFHFRYDAKKNQWVDGEIYDPVHGKTYKCKMWFENENTLRVRGYIGISALGRTMTWKKLS